MNLGMKVLASCLLSREAFNSLYENVDFKGLSPDIEWLLNLAEKYYETDEEAKAVDHNLFKEQVESKFPNTGKAQHLLDMIDEAYSATFSVPNYVELYLETKRKAIGFKLAGLLSSSDVEEEVVESLMSDYKKLAEPITEGTEDDNVIHNMSVEDAINKVFDKTGRIYLAPKGLQDATDGAMAGDSIIIFARPECFSADTEVLTPEGWLTVDKVTTSTSICVVDKELQSSFEEPETVVAQDGFDYLYHIRNKKGQLDLLVSPGHRMIYEKEGEIKEETAEDISYKQGYKSHNTTVATGSCAWAAEDALAVAFQADGRSRIYKSHGYSGKGYGYEIVIQKQRKIDRLRLLLTEADYSWKEWVTSSGRTGFYFRSKRLFDKDFSWLLVDNLSLEFCRRFSEELAFWDGSTRSITRWKYSNTNELAIDKAQAVVCQAGYNTFKSEVIDKRGYPTCYELHIRSNYTPVDGQSVLKERVVCTRDTKLYCFDVSTGIVLVRRNGVVSVQGNCGKTAFCCTLMAGFAWYNVPGIFFSNEEPTERVAARFQSTVTDMTAEEIKAEPEKATALMARRGYEHVRFIRLQFSTPAEIEKYVKMYGAKWFIVDQLRNMHIPRLEGKTQVLEESAKALREIAARHGAISIGVTQAGDSAEGKARLVQGDVDGSNTGIPGACDLMIGIGMTLDMEQQNTRMISLPKNKLSGRHVHFPLRIKPFVSRMENI